MVHSFPTRRSSDLWILNVALRSMCPPNGQTRIKIHRSEEHTSELQSHHPISYAVFCLKKKNKRPATSRPVVAKHSTSVVATGECPAPITSGITPPTPVLARPIGFFFFKDTATTEIYTGWYTLSLHDALPISTSPSVPSTKRTKSLQPGRTVTSRSEEHTSELQSHHPISYAVFCLKKKKT